MSEGSRSLRSGTSMEKAYVAFVNNTRRNINIVWINYKGEPVPFYQLQPGATRNCNTFVSHPWIFEDEASGERMHVANKNVFWPQQFIYRGAPIAARKIVVIHFPMRTLKENAIWKTAEYVGSARNVDRLEIPVTLKMELKDICSEYRNDEYTIRSV